MYTEKSDLEIEATTDMLRTEREYENTNNNVVRNSGDSAHDELSCSLITM